MRPASERFWAKVDKTETCWNWTAAKTSGGYGNFWLDGRMVRSHRFAYEAEVGRVPDGLFLDHLCHNPACVNPKHLRPVTNRENQEHRAGAARNNKSSGVRGVSWHKRQMCWVVSATSRGRTHHGGVFSDLAEAAAAAKALRNRIQTHNTADRAIAH